MAPNPFKGMNSDFAAKLQALINASGGRITIGSGYRSPAKQQEIWADALARANYNEYEARRWAAKPGSSNHNKGLAADLGGDLKLAHALAPQFGLHFPMNGKNGKGKEDWHVEPIDMPGGAPTNDAYSLGDEPAAAVEEPQDNLDAMFGNLSKLFSGDAGSGVGEADVTKMGEFNASVVSGATSSTADETLDSTEPGSVSTPTYDPANSVATPSFGGGDIDRFMAAISGQESGGNYNAVNGRTGASGRFQIMPSNWPAWSKEAGLGANAARTPENQDRVAKYKMEQYYKQFGNWGDVAVAWYGGPGAVKYSPAAKSKKQGKGDEPSINEYRDSILRKMGAK